MIGLLLAMTPPLMAASADQVVQKRLFAEPLTWVGDQPPAEVESSELLADIGLFEANGVGAGFDGLEKFLAAHPQSAWSPSLNVNMAEYYRSHGRYSLALTPLGIGLECDQGEQRCDLAKKVAVRSIARLDPVVGKSGGKGQAGRFIQING